MIPAGHAFRDGYWCEVFDYEPQQGNRPRQGAPEAVEEIGALRPQLPARRDLPVVPAEPKASAREGTGTNQRQGGVMARFKGRMR